MHITSRPLSFAVRRALVLALVLASSLFLPVPLAAQQKPGAAPKPADTQKPGAAPKPADAQKPAAAAAQKGPRTIDLASGDDMKYDKTTIEAKAGEEIRIRLTPKGAMPKIAMAHNVVVLKLGTDGAAFVAAGVAARPTDFIAPDKKAQVIAATPMAGNGETVEITFKVPTAPGKYPYVCTFPGHFVAGMKGTLIVKK